MDEAVVLVRTSLIVPTAEVPDSLIPGIAARDHVNVAPDVELDGV